MNGGKVCLGANGEWRMANGGLMMVCPGGDHKQMNGEFMAYVSGKRMAKSSWPAA